MKKGILVALAVLASRLQAKPVPVQDPDRPHSLIDQEANRYIKILEKPFGDFIRRTLEYNLEAFELLEGKGLLTKLSPPQITKITDEEVVSVLNHVNPKHDYGQFITLLQKQSALQVKVDLALASVLGVAGDLAPTNIPESKGEVNAKVTKDGRVQILDIDDLGLEIEPMELFLYGVDSFKVALEFLKNPDLKAIALQRLKKIFPNHNSEILQAIFDKKIRLLQEAVENKSISDFFQNPDNIDLIRQIQDSESLEEQQSKLQELKKTSPNTHQWLMEVKEFNTLQLQLVQSTVGDVDAEQLVRGTKGNEL